MTPPVAIGFANGSLLLAWSQCRCCLVIVLAAIVLLGCGRGPGDNQQSAPKPKQVESARVTEVKALPESEDDNTDDSQSFTIRHDVKPSGEKAGDDSKESVDVTLRPLKNAPAGSSAQQKKGTILTAPKDSLAAQIADSNSAVADWRPKWRSGGVGGVGITTAALSLDNSVFVVAETVAASDGVVSSTVAAISAYDWKTLRVINVDKRQIKKIVPMSGQFQFVYSTDAQADCDMPPEFGLLRFDLEPCLSKTVVCDCSNIDVCPSDSGFVFVKHQNPRGDSNDIEVFSTPGLRRRSGFRSGLGVGILGMTCDNRRLAVAGEEEVRFFDAQNLNFIRSVKREGRGAPDSFVSTKGDDQFALFSSASASSFYKSGTWVSLCESSGQAIFYNHLADIVVLESRNKNALLLFSPKDSAIVEEICPGELKPPTKHPALFIGFLPFSGRYLILDKGG